MSALAFLIPTSLVLGVVGLGCLPLESWLPSVSRTSTVPPSEFSSTMRAEGPVVDQVRSSQIR